MKNFIFKSEADFHKIVFNKLDMLLTEQRHQRRDLSVLLSLTKTLSIDKDLQKTVDSYFEDDEDITKDIPEDSVDGNSSS